MNPNVNVEGGLPKRDVGFNDITVRAAFVRKVFSLVTFMLTGLLIYYHLHLQLLFLLFLYLILLVVTAMTAIPFIYDPMMNFLNVKHGNPTALVLYLASYVIFLIVYIALICCESVRRRFPSNIICTGILTLAMGYMVGVYVFLKLSKSKKQVMMNAARYTLDSVLLCLIMTTISCGGIILFSMQTKYDLTKYLLQPFTSYNTSYSYFRCMGFLCIATLIMMVFAIVTIVYTVLLGLSILNMVYAGLAVLLLMGYLAVDIQVFKSFKLQMKYSVH